MGPLEEGVFLGGVTSGSAAWYESPAAAQLLDPPQKTSGREHREGVGVSLWVAGPRCVGLDAVANTPSLTTGSYR